MRCSPFLVYEGTVPAGFTVLSNDTRTMMLWLLQGDDGSTHEIYGTIYDNHSWCTPYKLTTVEYDKPFVISGYLSQKTGEIARLRYVNEADYTLREIVITESYDLAITGTSYDTDDLTLGQPLDITFIWKSNPPLKRKN